MLENWTSVVKKMPAGGRLEILHRPGGEDWVERVEGWWRGGTAALELVQSSKFATVHRGGGFYYKRFHRRDWRDALKHIVRPSRARRALEAGEKLADLGIREPRAVCLVEERKGPGVRESGLITEAIDGAPNLREWINNPSLERADKRRLLDAFGREVGRWHAIGLHHGDMRIGNILVRREGGGFAFYWLDNERNELFHPLPTRWRIHNLMQVNMERTGVTLGDRVRFWNAYAEGAGIDAEHARYIQREVLKYTQSRWRERGWLK